MLEEAKRHLNKKAHQHTRQSYVIYRQVAANKKGFLQSELLLIKNFRQKLAETKSSRLQNLRLYRGK